MAGGLQELTVHMMSAEGSISQVLILPVADLKPEIDFGIPESTLVIAALRIAMLFMKVRGCSKMLKVRRKIG